MRKLDVLSGADGIMMMRSENLVPLVCMVRVVMSRARKLSG